MRLPKRFIQGDIAIAEGRVAGIGSYAGEREIDLAGKYITPGFIDGHVHMESSMLSPLEFVAGRLQQPARRRSLRIRMK